MDALAYLIERRWPSGPRCAAALLAAVGLSWLNVKLLWALPSFFPTMHQHGLLNSLWGLALSMVVALGLASVALALLVAPLYGFHRSARLLQSWTRQRVLEEMICAGMSGRSIVDCLLWRSVRWWAVVTIPCLLAVGILYPESWPHFSGESLLWGLLLYVLGCSATGCVLLGVGCLRSPAGGQARLPLAVGAALLSAGPVLALGVTGGELRPLEASLACLYLIFCGRALSSRALESQGQLASWDIRFRRGLRFSTSKGVRPAENPIVARESFRGSEPADLLLRALMLGGFLFCSMVASLSHAPRIFLFLLFPAVICSAYRGASRMSQVVTEEVEGSTIETIRSTPMSSADFLTGWLRVVVGSQWRDLGLLLVGVFAVTVLSGNGALLNNGMVAVGVFLSAALPLVGAYIGASIAGQARTRAQISGQLMASFVAVAVVGVPQAIISAELIYPPITMAALTVLTCGVCWVLDAGARKSLNRTFLPQR